MSNVENRRARFRRRLVWLLLLVVAYFAICFVLAYRYVRPSRDIAAKPAGAVDLSIPGPRTEVPVWATPGLARGNPSSDTAFLLVHGYGGNREGWAQSFQDLRSAGFEVAVPEMPAHGSSPDPVCGFGIKEARVTLATANWMRDRMGEGAKVVAVGVSMGGAACWLASEMDPSAFYAIATEDSFARLSEASDRWFDMLLPGGRYVFAPVRWFSTWLSGVDPAKVNPVEAARLWKGRPAIVLHCREDRLMASSHAERLAEAAGCPLIVIDGAGHSEGYWAAPELYLKALIDLAKEARRNAGTSDSGAAKRTVEPKSVGR